MTINELKERLEYYDGKIPVLIALGQDKNNLTIVRQITGITEHRPTYENQITEIWLEIEEF